MTTATPVVSAKPVAIAPTPKQATLPDVTPLFIPQLELSKLHSSPTNPRQRFPEATMKELAESIKVRGVIQPVLVRPHPTKKGEYELVAGERRLRASKLAQRTHIPAAIQELDDLAVLDCQLIENNQREDVHPLEEAAAINNVIKAINPATGKPHTVNEVAAKIGKSRRHVYNRLALLKLTPAAQRALLDGAFDASIGLLLASLAHPATQAEAFDWVMQPSEPVSFREAAKFLQEHYTLDLGKDCGFDPAKKDYPAPEQVVGASIPSCADCPKRSGNNRDLFAHIKSANVCTDLPCFRSKIAADAALRLAELRKKGATIAEGKSAAAMFNKQGDPAPEWISPDMRRFDVAPSHKAHGKPLNEILGADTPIVHAIHPHTHKLEALVRNTDAIEALKARGLIKAPSPNPATAPGGASPLIRIRPMATDADRAKEKAELEIADALHESTLDAVRAAFADGLTEPAIRFLVRRTLVNELDYDGLTPWLAKHHATKVTDPDNNINEAISAVQKSFDATPLNLFGCALLDIALSQESERQTVSTELAELIKKSKIDVKAIEKKIRADHAAAVAAAAPPEKKRAAKGKTGGGK